MSTNSREENWRKPWWKKLLYNLSHPETTRLTDQKNLTVEIVEKRADMIVGKVVSGTSFNKDDPRYARDKLSGNGRKIWGVVFRFRFF